jgi:hypothetical protein
MKTWLHTSQVLELAEGEASGGITKYCLENAAAIDENGQTVDAFTVAQRCMVAATAPCTEGVQDSGCGADEQCMPLTGEAGGPGVCLPCTAARTSNPACTHRPCIDHHALATWLTNPYCPAVLRGIH